ncbi:DUF3027 domain-containing protein [Nonomuraea sp. NN258]|uniref:DUF3027 domain-containing protein n=1 Tax=Nonomuraea antri TaxID=2730852 RepID=UPI001569EBF0|nr:DUF3027 domain-containing protein [Nonomuraea antri]NRQ38597.1 DUF3027 domain-containing protein [Nonomuraea antri]
MTGIPGRAGPDQAELSAIHRRWVAERHRRTEDPDYREEWYYEQCGSCRFWLPLSGELGRDYGACANPASPFDGRVRFEHDGCEAFQEAGAWSTPEDHDAQRRWRLYLRALDDLDERGLTLLRDALADEPDRELALAVVLRALESVGASERRPWIELTPPGPDRERAESRAVDLDALAGGPSGVPGDWSDWLQRRLAATTADLATLDLLAQAGRTRRVRRMAAERRQAIDGS